MNTDNIKLCIVIPLYNHSHSIVKIVSSALTYFPVIVVDDGSTDEVVLPQSLKSRILWIRYTENKGKGFALKSGFKKARQEGFTHAITMDADGQHTSEDISSFASSCYIHPNTIWIGNRDLPNSDAPLQRKWANYTSNFFFKTLTGIRIPDTQCGFRCYPIDKVNELITHSSSYAYEMEILIQAAICHIPLGVVPIRIRYEYPEYISHFRPLVDILRICQVFLRFSNGNIEKLH